MVIKVDEKVFEAEVLDQDMPVIVDFYADWCGPCKMMSPVLEEISEDYWGRLKVCKINVDDNMNIARKYQVMSIPKFVFFDGGKPLRGLVGACSKEEFSEEVDKVLAGEYNG